MRLHWLPSVAVGLLTLALLAPVARAQDGAEEDDVQLDGPGALLSAPADMRRQRRREAKGTHRWVLTSIAAVAAGFDSNIHDSPSNAVQSAVGTFGARLEALRYTDARNRFRLTAEALGTRDTKTNDTSPYAQEVTAFWGRRRTGHYATSVSLKAKHHNDAATNINGQDLTRNFEYYSYQASVGLWLYPSRGSALRLSLRGRRRDYQETRGRASIDWWKAGPRIAYHLDLTPNLQTEIFYAFTLQRYDENLSSTAAGVELAGNPAEKHFFHRTGFDVEAELGDTLLATLEYDFKAKDDRFQGFESYQSHSVDLELQWSAGARWGLLAGGGYQNRDYDKRPGSNGATLVSDRWRAVALASFRLSPRTALFAEYQLSLRDTNRSPTRTTFRDYERHLVMVGWTVAR